MLQVVPLQREPHVVLNLIEIGKFVGTMFTVECTRMSQSQSQNAGHFDANLNVHCLSTV